MRYESFTRGFDHAFSAAILLVAGFQLIRLFVTEVAEFVLEAWHSPELPSAH